MKTTYDIKSKDQVEESSNRRYQATVIDYIIEFLAMIGAVAILMWLVSWAAGSPPQAPSVRPTQAPPCKLQVLCDCGTICECRGCICLECPHNVLPPLDQRTEWEKVTSIVHSLQEPMIIWLNYDSEYQRRTLSRFHHFVNKWRDGRRRKFKGYEGHIGVLVVEPKKNSLTIVKAINAKNCSVSHINEVWEKHKGLHKTQLWPEQYKTQSPMMYMQPMMYQGGSMMYSSPTRGGVLMRRGGACSS